MMITEHTKARIHDLRGKHDMDLEINFSVNPDFKNCVKVSVGKEEIIVDMKDLYEFVFWAANEEQQANLVPMSQTKVRTIEKLHRVEAKKDIKKGEFLNVRCVTNVPVEIWDGLAGMMGKRSVVKTGGFPVVKPKE